MKGAAWLQCLVFARPIIDFALLTSCQAVVRFNGHTSVRWIDGRFSETQENNMNDMKDTRNMNDTVDVQKLNLKQANAWLSGEVEFRLPRQWLVIGGLAFAILVLIAFN